MIFGDELVEIMKRDVLRLIFERYEAWRKIMDVDCKMGALSFLLGEASIERLSPKRYIPRLQSEVYRVRPRVTRGKPKSKTLVKRKK